MKYQKGISMPAVILAAVLLAFGLLLAGKLLPAYNEASAVSRVVHKIAREAGTKSIDQIRMAWVPAASADDISSITGQELNISRKGPLVVITYEYTRKMPLFGNLSLAMDFSGSSADPE